MPTERTGQAQRSLFVRLRVERSVVVVFSSIAIVFLALWQGTERLDNLVYDVLTRLDGKPARNDIAIVAIDDESLARLGPWPWPRVRIAALINAIGQAEPKGLGVNILLAGDRDMQGDQSLAKAIAGTGSPVYLSVAVANTGSGADGGAVALVPSFALRGAATNLGQTSFPVDADGIVRRAYATLPAQGVNWPSLAQLLAGNAARATTLRNEPWLIPFATGRFLTVPAWKLLEDPASRRSLQNRRVLLGVTATGIDPMFPTPLSGADGYLSGTQIEAHLLAAVLDNGTRKPVSLITRVIASLVMAWVALDLANRVKPNQSVAFTLAAIASCLAIDLLAFTAFNLWVPPAAGICGFVVGQSLWAWRRTSAIMAFMGREIAQYQASSRASAPPATMSDPLVGQAEMLAHTLQLARDSHQFITDTIDHLPVPVLVVNLQGQISFANDAARRLFAAHSLEGNGACNFADLFKTFRLDEPYSGPAGHVSRSVTGDGAIAIRGPDGSNFELLLGVIRRPDGGFQAWIVQLIDITAIRSAAQQREEVMSLLTHDLRSPLAAIVASVSQSTAERADRSLKAASRFALRALKMADDYVQLSKANASQFHLEPASCRLILEDAIEEILPQARASGSRIRMGGEASPWLVTGDISLLHRCLINLIGNAVQHGGQGCKIYCSIRNLEVSGQRMVEISIHDWGPEIPPEAVPAIFEPFNQGHGAASRQGAGLGLALVATVARGHGGSIAYERVGKRCTRFRMRLPATDELEDSLEDDLSPQQCLLAEDAAHE